MPELPTPFTSRPLATADADYLAEAVKALADPTRLQLLNILWLAPDGAATTGRLVALLGSVKQSTVSHHLAILDRAGLISRKRDGIWVFSTLNLDGFAALIKAIQPGGAR